MTRGRQLIIKEEEKTSIQVQSKTKIIQKPIKTLYKLRVTSRFTMPPFPLTNR